MMIKEVAEKFEITADTLRYYEKIGMIPEVTRTDSGIRNYQEDDLRWVELAICMRRAGLPVETMVEYVSLYQQGVETFDERLELLKGQMGKLIEQRENINVMIDRLDVKIKRYQQASREGNSDFKQ